MPKATALVAFLTALSGVQDPVLILKSGGVQFPDGTVQTTAALGAMAPVEDTGQDDCWSGAGDSIPCASTGQDGELQAGVPWPAPRFADNGDGTVLDRLTRLVWLRDADCFGAIDWESALGGANALADGACELADGSVAGDWRLANVKELMSLVSYGESAPALPVGHPFVDVEIAGLGIWSSTTAAQRERALALSFADGTLLTVAKSDARTLWPVRGGLSP